MEKLLTIHDIKSLGYCYKGQKAFFRMKGWDVDKIWKEGVPAEWFADDVSIEGQRIYKWAKENGY